MENNNNSIPKIKVCVRKRPPNKKEISNNDIDIIQQKSKRSLVVKELKNKLDLSKYIEEHYFQFDRVFDEDMTNKDIYEETVRPMIDAAFKNHSKVSCFAYGQTGSGKTYTMMGDPYAKDLTCPGLYLLSSYDVFNYLQEHEYADYEIWVSFYEIYCNKLFDLLNNKNTLEVREDGKGTIHIVGLVEKQIINLKNLMDIIDFGLKSRTTGVTGANNDSSRSHAILQIDLKDQEGESQGKITFVDLAGSERAVDTIDTNKQTKIDGAEINKSLLALKECIRSLDQGKLHIPFRQSKLTLVLRDSFIGNCNTLMIANISPCLSCSENTLNTLRYADRVKELRKETKDKTVKKDSKEEQLADLLMMPRQHNKTVKYNVTIKKNNPNKPSSIPKKGDVYHIDDIVNKEKKYTNNLKVNKDFNDKVMKTKSSSSLSHGKNKYGFTSKTQKNYMNPEQYISKYEDIQILSEEDLQKYTTEHEKLINNILNEEDNLKKEHKEHIDEMVETIKEEVNGLNNVDKLGSDIKVYAETLNSILINQMYKIQKLQKKLFNFQNMLKDEEVLFSKFNNDENINNNNKSNDEENEIIDNN
jgi:kinesin family protein 2/24